MSDTLRLQMPLLDAAQAQKHVTVNEALARIDALAAGRVDTRGGTVPPSAPNDGDVHLVGNAATGDWTGHDGELAIFANGGWMFVAPWAGTRAWIVSEGREIVFNGATWVGKTDAGSASGASTVGEVLEIDHVLSAGATSTVAGAIPDKAIVLGVTARVTEAVTGTTTWKLGTTDGADRYGGGIGVSVNSFAHGVSGSPMAYYGPTDLLITAEGGTFTGGRVLLAIHLNRLVPPAPV